jgi:4-aminobutyrate aminotransferase-like enzyme
MFTCTGGEASDLALRIAHYATGGTGVIVTENAYHGLTAAVSAISPSLGAGVPLGNHVRTVPPPDAAVATALGRDLGEWFAENVAAAAADLARHGIRPSALIVDTIFSSDGVFADPPGFLAAAAAAIREAGGLFIADEVQPGFGRTGDTMWGFMRHGVVPDVVVLGKPMGNGIPHAGIVAKPEVLAEFGSKARYFNTFGGNPVSCAAGMAVFEVIEREALMQNAKTVGDHLMNGLRALGKTFPGIGEVRGAGLFIGVDLVRPGSGEPAPETALKLVNELRDRRILISASGRIGAALKIRPPLCFSIENADYFLSAMKNILESA